MLGGSVHVQAVAEGLAALGHDVHVAVQAGGDWPAGPVHWHQMAPPFGRAELRWMRQGGVKALARDVRADVIMERYHNFGGEGVLAARRARRARRARGQRTCDRLSRVQQSPARSRPARRADAAVARSDLPADVALRDAGGRHPAGVGGSREGARGRMGRRRSRFRPDAPRHRAVRPQSAAARSPCLPAPSGRGTARSISRRRWRGCMQAGDRSLRRVFIGDGPERDAAERVARDLPAVQFTGALPHDRLPAALAHADIGVAPFDPSRHAPLRLGFYWSPAEDLRVHGRRVCRSSRRHCPASRVSSSTGAKACSTIRGSARARPRDQDPGRPRSAARMGAAARARVVRDFSWEAHCRAARARACRRWRPRERAAARAARHRRVPADLRRQRLEHVRAGARARCARPPRRGRQGRRVRTDAACSTAPVRRLPRHRVLPAGRERSRSSATTEERAAVGVARAIPAHPPAARAALDIVHGQHVMTTVPSIRGGERDRHAGGGHGPRLLAGLLLVGSHLRSVAAGIVSGVLGGHDDALRASRAPARAPSPPGRSIPYMRANLQTKRRRWRSAVRSSRRAMPSRATSARARRSSRPDAALYDSESGRHGAARRGARAAAAADGGARTCSTPASSP